jgi:hypothetical protein
MQSPDVRPTLAPRSASGLSETRPLHGPDIGARQPPRERPLPAIFSFAVLNTFLISSLCQDFIMNTAFRGHLDNQLTRVAAFERMR